MSMEVLAVDESVRKIQHGQNGNISFGGIDIALEPEMSDNGSGKMDLHGHVNLLLGGAMLSSIVMVVVLMCYCCHRNIRTHQPQDYTQYWRAEPDVQSLEVFTMDAHAMSFEEGAFVNLPRPAAAGPPPTYESLIFDPLTLPSPVDKKELRASPGDAMPITLLASSQCAKEEAPPDEDAGLPTYEAALKLEANGCVYG